jgi:hypothetical protein
MHICPTTEAAAAPRRRPLSVDKRIALRATFRPFLDRSALRGQSAIEQMAEDFLLFAANAGAVLKDDLELLGWTPAQIDRHAADARRYAHRSAEG